MLLSPIDETTNRHSPPPFISIPSEVPKYLMSAVTPRSTFYTASGMVPPAAWILVAVVLIPTVADIFDPKHEMEYESYSTTLSTFLERENVTFLDLMPAFKAEEKTQALFLDEVFHHFSEAGNALVARELNLKLPQLISEFPVSKASPREE